jgi:hypothetical protein
LKDLFQHAIYLDATTRTTGFYNPVLYDSIAKSFDQQLAAAIAVGVLSLSSDIALVDVS